MPRLLRPSRVAPSAPAIVEPVAEPVAGGKPAGKSIGVSGAVPPADAPYEVSQPLNHAAMAAQIAAKRSLPSIGEQLAAGAELAEAVGGVSRRERPPVMTVLAETGVHEIVEDFLPAPLTDDDRKRMPAASDSDSPARGIPQPIADPNKQITGGLGHPVGDEAAYYALDGLELAVMVGKLCRDLAERVQNDLRFTEALTYPRVQARVVVEISGFAANGGAQEFVVPLIEVHDKTPIEAAREYADEFAFVVSASIAEVNAAGESVAPPDQLRAEHHLERPMKRKLGVGPQAQFVDRLPPGMGGR